MNLSRRISLQSVGSQEAKREQQQQQQMRPKQRQRRESIGLTPPRRRSSVGSYASGRLSHVSSVDASAETQLLGNAVVSWNKQQRRRRRPSQMNNIVSVKQPEFIKDEEQQQQHQRVERTDATRALPPRHDKTEKQKDKDKEAEEEEGQEDEEMVQTMISKLKQMESTMQKRLDQIEELVVDENKEERDLLLSNSSTEITSEERLMIEKICRDDDDDEIGRLVRRKDDEFYDEYEQIDGRDSDIDSDAGLRDEGNLTLEQNSFSFLISSKPFSVPFWTGLIVFGTKNGIFYLTMTNILDSSSAFNKLNLPVSVATPVTIAQLFALIIAVLTQDDLLTALVLFYHGYSRDMLRVFGRNGRGGGTQLQWTITFILSFLDGLFGVTVTFMMIVTSMRVLDVVLNFAVVEFVTGLDEATFYISQLGLLGRRNKKEAMRVATRTYKSTTTSQEASEIVRTLGLIFMVVAILSVWVYFNLMQANGFYATEVFIVQFDDNIRRELAAHSGMYRLEANFHLDPAKRFRYKEVRAGGGQFAYCGHTKRWNFFLEGDDPCGASNVMVTSIQTGFLDLSLVADETWFVVLADQLQTLPSDDFYMLPGCKMHEECGGEGGGVCLHNQCVCEEGFFGYRCVHTEEEACSSLEVDERFAKSFSAVRQVATSYERIRGIQVYDRPAYYNKETNDIILFTGVRWAVTNLQLGFDMATIQEFTVFAGSNRFNARSIRHLDLLSHPVLFRSPEDVSSAPVNLNWDIVTNQAPLKGALLSDPLVPASLLCSHCDERNRCYYEGTCRRGSCTCKHGAKGPLCQLSPEADGKCDQFFNTPEFEYDGGDCCEATCVSQLDHICGEVQEGSLNSVVVGFPFCKNPEIVGNCDGTSKPCFIRNSIPVPSISQDTTVTKLTANGRTMVVAEPLMRTIRVYDLHGFDWVQRGKVITGEAETLIGIVFDVASPPKALLRKVLGYVPLYIAAYDVLSCDIKIFGWNEPALDWVSEGSLRFPENCPENFSPTTLHLECALNGSTNSTSLVVLMQVDSNMRVWSRPLEGTNWVETMRSEADLSALSQNGAVVATLEGTILSLVGATINFGAQLASAVDGNVIVAMDIVGNDHHTGVSLVYQEQSSAASGSRYTVDYLFLNKASMSLRRGPAVTLDLRELVDVIFSKDGFTVVLVDTDDQSPYKLHTVSFDEATETVKEFTKFTAMAGHKPAYISSHFHNPGAPVSVSDQGLSLLDGTSGVSNVYTAYNRCNPRTEFTFHISTANIFDPGRWDLLADEEYNGFQVRTQISGCSVCESTRFNEYSVLVEDVCVPNRLRSCIVLHHSMRSPASAFGFAAYTIQNGEKELFASLEGDHTAEQRSIDFPGGHQSKSCSRPKMQCSGKSETRFALVHTQLANLGNTTINPTVSWKVTDSTGQVYVEDLISSGSGGGIHELCLPRDRCYFFQSSTEHIVVQGRNKEAVLEVIDSPVADFRLFFDGTEIVKASWKGIFNQVFGRC